MMTSRIGWFAAILFTLIQFSAIAMAGEQENPAVAIDGILAKHWKSMGIQPSSLCSDAQFVRRASLDLIGRIPTVKERQQFLQQPDRRELIGQLLKQPEFSRHFSEVWTASLNGYANAFNSDREVLRAWLQKQIRQQRGYDRIVFDLISARGNAAFDGPVNFLLRHRERPTVKVCRLFLGVRLDCARCHDHPFARWKQEDFANVARFFSATRRRTISQNNYAVFNSTPSGSPPRFLTGATAKTSQWRDELAYYVTSCKPFRRTFANRLWYQMLGRGIVHPPDDFHADNQPTVPKLLTHLMERVTHHKFRLRPLLTEICLSRAYQAASRVSTTDAPPASTATGRQTTAREQRVVFARFTPKPLTVEQLYESLHVATARPTTATARSQFIRQVVQPSLDEDYSETWAYRGTVQGLMNRLRLERPAAGKDLEQVFAAVLGRTPTAVERKRCRSFSLTDVTFALLNSSEFMFNH